MLDYNSWYFNVFAGQDLTPATALQSENPFTDNELVTCLSTLNSKKIFLALQG